MSATNETTQGRLAEPPITPEVTPQRSRVVNAFNSVFVRFREETAPIKNKLTWNPYDRSRATEEEREQVVGFNIVADSVRLVAGNSDSLNTDQPLSPSLPSYTYSLKIPRRSPYYTDGGEEVLQEHIVITPLLKFLERERETLTEMVDDAERFGEDAMQLVQALARTDQELATLSEHSTSYQTAHGFRTGTEPQFFHSRRSLEAFYISKNPLRMSTATYQEWQDHEHWVDAAVELLDRVVLIVPA